MNHSSILICRNFFSIHEKNELSSKFASSVQKSFHWEDKKKRTVKGTKTTHSICAARVQYVNVLLGNYATFHNKDSEKEKEKVLFKVKWRIKVATSDNLHSIYTLFRFLVWNFHFVIFVTFANDESLLKK